MLLKRENSLIAIKTYINSFIAIKNYKFPSLPSVSNFLSSNCHYSHMNIYSFLHCHPITIFVPFIAIVCTYQCFKCQFCPCLLSWRLMNLHNIFIHTPFFCDYISTLRLFHKTTCKYTTFTSPAFRHCIGKKRNEEQTQTGCESGAWGFLA